MNPSTDRAVLLVSYYFPPIQSMGAVRNLLIARHFKQYFNQVHVLVSKNRNLLPQDTLMKDDEGFNLFEASTFDYRTITNLRGEKHTHYSEATKESKSGKVVVKLLNSFPFNLILGEGGLLYSLIGFWKICRLLRKQKNITHIYSSFRPYSDHFTVFLVKIFYPSIYWIADFRDIHIDPLKDNVYGLKFQRWCNRVILKKANVVTSVSKGTMDHLVDYHKDNYLLRNGIHKMLSPKKKKEKLEKFTISYTGSMYGDKRDPTILLKVLARLLQNNEVDPELIQLVYAGKDEAFWNTMIQQFDLESIFISKGLVPMEMAVGLQQNSHINLLLAFSSPEVTGGLTGKLYEYLAADNPILLIIKGTKDEEFEEIFEWTNAGLVTYHDSNDEEVLAQFILQYYKEWVDTKQITSPIRKEKLKELEWDHLMNKFMEHIQVSKISHQEINV